LTTFSVSRIMRSMPTSVLTWRGAVRPRALAWILIVTLVAVTLAVAPLRWTGAASIGAILLAVILLRPSLGLVALAIAIPFGQAMSFSSANISVIECLVALVVGAWLLRGMGTRRLALTGTPLLWPLGIFLWFGALSLLKAASYQQGVPEWLKWAEFAAVYVVAATTLQRQHVRWVLIALFAAGIYEVGLGAYQFSQQAGPEAFGVLGGFVRAYGTFRQPNPYAGYLGYLMPVALSLMIGALANWWNRRTSGSLVLVLLLAAVTLLLLLGIGLSWSRGAWLGALVAAGVVVAFRNRRAILICGMAVLLLAMAFVLLGTAGLPNVISQRLVTFGDYVTGPDPSTVEITDQNFSVLERIAHWQAGLRMFESAPWIGVGIGNYGVAYPRFSSPHWYDPLGHAHNLYINFLAETGILGGLAFLVAWGSVAVLAIREAHSQDALLKSLALGLLGTIVYLTVHNLFDNLFVQHLQLQLALLIGAVASLKTASIPSPR
jgi:putative inorganic carbon (hco3(-)) transporter